MRAQEQKISAAPLIGANAQMVGQYNLHREVAVSQWSIGRNHVSYEKPDSHTLSLYLRGGDNSFRDDQRSNHGHQGAICLMPQGHASSWHISGDIDFAHLYFTDRILKQFAADHFDQDIRTIDLRDLTYQEDMALRHMMQGYLRICSETGEQAGPVGEQLLYQIFHHLIELYNGHTTRKTPIRGGLAPHHVRHIKEMINARLENRLSIAELASHIGQSPFHFARKFKESFGETPAHYISRQRVELVKKKLRSTEPLAEIASQAGFAQQSHMTEQFRKQTGFTPHAYRLLMKN